MAGSKMLMGWLAVGLLGMCRIFASGDSSYHPRANFKGTRYEKPIAETQALGSDPVSEVDYVDGPLAPLYDFLIQRRLQRFCKLLRDAGLEQIIKDLGGSWTLFAPTDASFIFLPGGTLEDLQRNPQLLRDFILYHFVVGDFPSTQIQNEMLIDSVQGAPLRLNIYGQIKTVSGAQILEPDLVFEMGRVYIIDRPLYPIPSIDIITYLQRNNKELYRLLLDAGLVDYISSGTFTLLAPDDQAFGYLSVELKDALKTNTSLAERILLNHILPGSVYVGGIKDGMQWETVGGSLITFTVKRGLTFANDIPIVLPDVPLTNGVIHVLNRVLLPEGIEADCQCKPSSERGQKPGQFPGSSRHSFGPNQKPQFGQGTTTRRPGQSVTGQTSRPFGGQAQGSADNSEQPGQRGSQGRPQSPGTPPGPSGSRPWSPSRTGQPVRPVPPPGQTTRSPYLPQPTQPSSDEDFNSVIGTGVQPDSDQKRPDQTRTRYPPLASPPQRQRPTTRPSSQNIGSQPQGESYPGSGNENYPGQAVTPDVSHTTRQADRWANRQRTSTPRYPTPQRGPYGTPTTRRPQSTRTNDWNQPSLEQPKEGAEIDSPAINQEQGTQTQGPAVHTTSWQQRNQISQTTRQPYQPPRQPPQRQTTRPSYGRTTPSPQGPSNEQPFESNRQQPNCRKRDDRVTSLNQNLPICSEFTPEGCQNSPYDPSDARPLCPESDGQNCRDPNSPYNPSDNRPLCPSSVPPQDCREFGQPTYIGDRRPLCTPSSVPETGCKDPSAAYNPSDRRPVCRTTNIKDVPSTPTQGIDTPVGCRKSDEVANPQDQRPVCPEEPKEDCRPLLERPQPGDRRPVCKVKKQPTGPKPTKDADTIQKKPDKPQQQTTYPQRGQYPTPTTRRQSWQSTTRAPQSWQTRQPAAKQPQTGSGQSPSQPGDNSFQTPPLTGSSQTQTGPLAPQPGKSPSQPQSSADPSNPQTGFDIEPDVGFNERPGAGVEPLEPQTGSYPSQPQSGRYPSQPQSTGRPSQPQSGRYPSQQQSGRYPSQQQSGSYPSQQPSGLHPSPPQSGSYPSQPQTETKSSQPQTDYSPSTGSLHPSSPDSGSEPSQQPESPQSGSYPSQPQTGSYPSSQPGSPQSGNYPPQRPGSPQSGSYPSQPQTGSYPRRPGSPQSGPYPSQPQTDSYPPQGSGSPQSGSYPSQPQAGSYPPRRPGSPQSGSYPSQPQTGSYPQRPGSPQSGLHPSQPQTDSEGPGSPQSGSYPSQPQTGSYPTQRPGSPQSGSYPSQPQTGSYPSQRPGSPQAGSSPSQPQSGTHPSQPHSGIQPSQPQPGVPGSPPIPGTGQEHTQPGRPAPAYPQRRPGFQQTPTRTTTQPQTQGAPRPGSGDGRPSQPVAPQGRPASGHPTGTFPTPQRRPTSPARGTISVTGTSTTPTEDSRRTLYEIVEDPALLIRGRPVQLTRIFGLFHKAGIQDILNEPGPTTVFLPSDDAFALLPQGVVEQLEENPELLRQILLYHVAKSEILPSAQGESYTVPSVEGNQLVITMLNGGKLIFISGAKAVAVTRANNGIFYVINQFLYPLPHHDIVGAIQTRPDLSTLNFLLPLSGLVEMLRGQTPYTLLAPTDNAFAQLPQNVYDELTKNSTALQEILLNHIIEGAHYGREFFTGGTFPSARGGKLKFQVVSYGYQVNDVNIKTPEIVTGSGVIHLVDQILLEEPDLLFFSGLENSVAGEDGSVINPQQPSVGHPQQPSSRPAAGSPRPIPGQQTPGGQQTGVGQPQIGGLQPPRGQPTRGQIPVPGRGSPGNQQTSPGQSQGPSFDGQRQPGMDRPTHGQQGPGQPVGPSSFGGQRQPSPQGHGYQVATRPGYNQGQQTPGQVGGQRVSSHGQGHQTITTTYIGQRQPGYQTGGQTNTGIYQGHGTFQTGGQPNDVADLARSMGLNQFANWINNTGLLEKVHDGGVYTVFAPTDDAVESLPQEMAYSIQSNPEKVKSILQYHIIPQRLNLNSVTNEETTATLLQGKTIRFNVYENSQPDCKQLVTASGTPLGGALATMGSIQVIPVTQVLYQPAGDLLKIVEASPILHKLNEAVKSARLTWVLSGTGPMTIFAPSDTAFDSLSEEQRKTLIDDKQAFSDVLKRHIVRGTYFSSGIQEDLEKKSENYKPIKLSLQEGILTVNSIPVTYSDITATNGVLHVIDHFL